MNLHSVNLEKRKTALKLELHTPSDIMGSIVKQWPAFITPMALFSARQGIE